MRIVFTICFFSCFLFAIGQDSLSLLQKGSLFQDSGFIRHNTFINDFPENKATDFINEPLHKITDNQLVSSTKNKVKSTFSNIGKSLKQKPPFHGTTSIETRYVNNSFAPSSTNGFYTTARIAAQVSILKIPLNAGVSFQMHDKQFRMDYTAMNLNFDVNSYKDKLKTQYQDYIGDIKNYFGDGLGQIMEQFQDSVGQLEKYKSMLSDKDYYRQTKQYASQVTQMEDSLRIPFNGDSLNYSWTPDSSLYKRYTETKDTLNVLRNVPAAYKNLSNYVKKYQQYSQMLDEYKGYVDKVKNMDDITKLPNAETALGKAGINIPKFNFLSGVQKMNIGRVAADVSRYTFRQQTLYGVQLDYLIKKKIYVGGAFGWASQFNMQLTPSFYFNREYRSFNATRLAAYLRGGYGALNDNHVHVIWTGFGDKFQNTTSIIMERITAQANSVLAVEFLQKIGKSVIIKGEAATSNSSNSNRSASYVPLVSKPPLSYAAYTEVTGDIKITHSKITARGEVVSSNFISMTAPFLRKNIAGYSLGLEQSLFKDKVTYSGMLQHSFQNYADKRRLNALISSSNTLMIQASEKATFQLYYGWFGNIPGKESILPNVNQTHTATLAQQYSYGGKKVRMTTVLSSAYSYSRTEAPEQHMPPMHNMQQGVQQQFVFPKQISWNIGVGGLYRTQPITVTDNNGLGWWAETGNTFAIKKVANLKYQLKYLYDPLWRHQLNISHTTDINLYKGLRLNLSGMYFINLTKQYAFSNRINATAGIAYSW